MVGLAGQGGGQSSPLQGRCRAGGCHNAKPACAVQAATHTPALALALAPPILACAGYVWVQKRWGVAPGNSSVESVLGLAAVPWAGADQRVWLHVYNRAEGSYSLYLRTSAGGWMRKASGLRSAGAGSRLWSIQGPAPAVRPACIHCPLPAACACRLATPPCGH